MYERQFESPIFHRDAPTQDREVRGVHFQAPASMPRRQLNKSNIHNRLFCNQFDRDFSLV